jgi:hypothetical protein
MVSSGARRRGGDGEGADADAAAALETEAEDMTKQSNDRRAKRKSDVSGRVKRVDFCDREFGNENMRNTTSKLNRTTISSSEQQSTADASLPRR